MAQMDMHLLAIPPEHYDLVALVVARDRAGATPSFPCSQTTEQARQAAQAAATGGG
jgi:hypothetical protein